GPQCEPEYGDWYARGMYEEGSDQYKYHVAKYGHPSKFGFKDVIHQWKADQWDPNHLVSLYKKAGAKYFFAMANHHDNLDLWDSKHHRWNSVKLGPKKNIVAGWAKAAKEAGLPFGLSVHASHAWTWYETAQHADKNGPLAGIPYDGKLRKQDGKGKWWEGLDPQELYAQNHALSKDEKENKTELSHWDWGSGASQPSKEYCENYYKRTIELIDKFAPELIYFDDSVLPFHGLNDVGLRIAAHHYNQSIKRNNGMLKAVLNGKILNEQQRECMIWDIERGQSNVIEPFTWQTDTCIGNWHYDKRVYDRKGYKSAKTVVHTLIDVVSKNGNLLLNIPLKGNGTIDEQELAIVEGITAWMQVNSSAVYDTRPWRVFGEGPASDKAAPLKDQGFNEGKGKPFGAQDIRFTTKGETLFAFVLGWPDDGVVKIHSLGKQRNLWERSIARVEMLGDGSLTYDQREDALIIQLPEKRPAQEYAVVLKIS
ncbi:MAG: alpha-L-fucosidase, partial [Chitinophagaceae bacterium]|nr:alpha-L-fucosidase [Chitinophagaceae bacterium]